MGIANMAYAQELNAEQVKKQINQVASQMKSMQCDFVQTKHLKMLNDKMVSKGKMYYQQNDKLRWEYTSPYQYTFILNGTKVQIKNNRRNDVIDVKQNKLFKEITRIMMNSMIGKCLSDEKDFNVTIGQTSTEWTATMVPKKKEMGQMFQKIILHFNKQRFMVSKVELIEKNGDKTIIVLNNIQTNKAINAKIFTVN